MSLDVLSRTILSKAQSEKEVFDAQLEKESSLLESESEKRLSSFKESLKQKHDVDLKSLKVRLLGNSQSKAKKEILFTKSSLLEEVYSKAYDELLSLDAKEKKSFYKSLIAKAKKEFSFDTLICSSSDKKIVESLTPAKVKLTTSKDLEGLQFEGNKGQEVLDYSFKSLLKQTIVNTEDEVQSVLFE